MLSKERFARYDRDIRQQTDEAMWIIRKYSRSLSWGNTTQSRAAARKLLSDKAAAVIWSYGDNASAIAAELYDELAALEGANVPSAIMEEAASLDEIESSVNYNTRSAFDMQDGKLKPIDDKLHSAVESMVVGRVNRMANGTIHTNALRDHVTYARVPTSSNPCAFCVMLASRGFVYTSKKSALGSMTRYHDHCSCRAVPSFDGTGLEGYDEQKYLDMYNDAALDVPKSQTKEILSNMRKQNEGMH